MKAGFENRRQAGRVLAEALRAYAGRPGLLVLALPRGGVPVGFEVARALQAPFDVFNVRKLGVPGHEELAMGALAVGGTRVINMSTVRAFAVSATEIDAIIEKEEKELARRERLYRSGLPPLSVADRPVVIVDDGLATGSTMRAALESLRQLAAARIVVAVPLAHPEARAELALSADELVCALSPAELASVGQYYADFSQVSDDEVLALLAKSRRDERSTAAR